MEQVCGTIRECKLEGADGTLRASVKRWFPFAVHPKHMTLILAAFKKFHNRKVNRTLVPACAVRCSPTSTTRKLSAAPSNARPGKQSAWRGATNPTMNVGQTTRQRVTHNTSRGETIAMRNQRVRGGARCERDGVAANGAALRLLVESAAVAWVWVGWYGLGLRYQKWF